MALRRDPMSRDATAFDGGSVSRFQVLWSRRFDPTVPRQRPESPRQTARGSL